MDADKPSPPPPAKKPETVAKEKPAESLQPVFARMRDKVKKLNQEILDYYEGDKEILDGLHDKSMPSEANLRARMALRILDARKPGSNVSFVIANMGSSVTAGHDGFGQTAYPAVLERVLAPMMESAGVHLTVRNGAVGGRGPWPAGFCLTQHAGRGVDVITREWEYWPFDDGIRGRGITKREGVRGHVDSQMAAFELFMRNALRVDGQPVTYFLDMQHEGPGGDGKSGQMIKKHITPPQGVLRPYLGQPVNAFSLFGKPFDHLRSRPLAPQGPPPPYLIPWLRAPLPLTYSCLPCALTRSSCQVIDGRSQTDAQAST